MIKQAKQIEQIIVVFKTHLDLGFTGLAEEILRQYNEQYIPRAIAVGEEILATGRPEGFTWTTGSWLIHQHLKQASKEQTTAMELAIQKGMISWHALPFTLHSEFADAGLYEYGLSLSKELDKRFDKVTIGAKNTDVPGHTRGIVPLLHDAGVEFLHIGVNPASSYPDVPDMFRWRDPSGKSIVVLYDKGDYGGFTQIPGTTTAVCLAHTGDNHGPQSRAAVLKVYDNLQKEYPKAQIRAGGLNEVAKAMLNIADTLPIFTQEIGDTWIHGVASDPQKASRYRALLRMASTSDAPTKTIIYENILPIPEHTWGLDEKTFLHDHAHFSKENFNSAKGNPDFMKMEQSWREQRNKIYSSRLLTQIELGLHFIKLMKKTLFCKQVIESTIFHYSAIFQHHNIITKFST